jgi:hypothetical protein
MLFIMLHSCNINCNHYAHYTRYDIIYQDPNVLGDIDSKKETGSKIDKKRRSGI